MVDLETLPPLLGDGIFTQEGAEWKHSRESLPAPLPHKCYEDIELFKHSVNDVDILSGRSEVVDLQPLFFRLTLDTSPGHLFGESVKSFKAPECANEQPFSDAFITAQAFVTKHFRLPDPYWMIGDFKFQRSCENVHPFLDRSSITNHHRGNLREAAFSATL